MRFSPILVVLGACGGGGSSDSLDLKLANTVVAAVRTGDTWKPVTMDATGAAKLDIDGPTQLAIVCDNPSYFNYYTLFLGPGIDDSDGPLDFSCVGAVAPVSVTITAPSTTDVFLGFSFALGGGGTIEMMPGTYDVVALDDSTTPPRFEIRRGIAITGPMTLTFDLATSGTPMAPISVEVTNAGPGETPSRRTHLFTAGRTSAFVFASTTGEPFQFPASALQAGDLQTVGASTTSETLGSRSVRSRIDGTTSTVSVALPDYLTSVTATATSATWQSSRAWTSFYYGINNADFSVLWDVSVFDEWTEAGGEVDTIEIPDPTGIPGWQATWNLGATTDFDWYFSANEDRETESFGASRLGKL